MCCHRRIIYATCGHSIFCPKPLVECRHASIDPILEYSTTCEIVAHPYKSWRVDQLCPSCEQRRDALLREIDESNVVRFDEWQWKVSYGLPEGGGKDYWGKKADEREEKSKEKKDEKRRKSTKRFSWRRKTKDGKSKSAKGDQTPRIDE
ncbi:hypothetical protein PRZ48_001188 [Zasmidium cellare]|uniref:Uncharacterized protein n=1 Tax=Zasmidium cellare TaxID=395010 RepID=A0ABR0F1X3_ZASCE|nr:hypothetical protein PRZ48_001188 [Zasmidium cellare]